MPKSLSEDKVKSKLFENSGEFLSELKSYILKKGKSAGLNQGLSEGALQTISLLNTTAILKKEFVIPGLKPNTRNYKIDLYYDESPLRIIIEVKKTDAGFRSIAQAACYNMCLPPKSHDIVVLLAKEKGKDFYMFCETCLTSASLNGVVFVTFKDLNIDRFLFK